MTFANKRQYKRGRDADGDEDVPPPQEVLDGGRRDLLLSHPKLVERASRAYDVVEERKVHTREEEPGGVKYAHHEL